MHNIRCGRNGAGSRRRSASGARSAVKPNAVNPEAAALVLTVIRQLKVDSLGTTTLVVGHRGTA